MKRLKRLPSPATLISLLALFVAVGGTAWAAATITGRNVKNGSLTGKDVKKNSLTGRDIRESSLRGVLRGSKTVTRSAAVAVQGGAHNGNYNSSAVNVACAPGEFAVSVGTQWSDPTENIELTTVYARLTVDPKGKPIGATARGSSDTPATHAFTVLVLCSKP
jgi:hypothetical protein